MVKATAKPTTDRSITEMIGTYHDLIKLAGSQPDALQDAIVETACDLQVAIAKAPSANLAEFRTKLNFLIAEFPDASDEFAADLRAGIVADIERLERAA